jgi:epoxide hydrolase
MSSTDEELEDLRQRLHATRWPEPQTVDDWSQGVPLSYLQEFCNYWADGYDWRAREAYFNRFPQFRASVGGLDVHFLHVRSPHPDAFPLVITHGWPGSFTEFHKMIEPLTNPTAYGGKAEDAFHVVCPSVPGYGFSEKPRATGWGRERIAEAWAELMAGLGYPRYGAQGGDVGSVVSTTLAAVDAPHCAGIHLNMVPAVHFRSVQTVLKSPTAVQEASTPEEQRALAGAANYERWDSAYSKQQQTRPQTLGYGLTDSPAAQAAWILQAFWAWTDCNGHPENALSRQDMLDDIMVYWLSATATSSARLYWEAHTAARSFDPVAVPTGIAVFPKEIVPAVRSWCDKSYLDIRQWTEMPRGGHFAALEQPDLLVEDVRSFFSRVR